MQILKFNQLKQVTRESENERKKGMTLVELLISSAILLFVVGGAISSAVLFAKIAADHENRAEFSADMRSGMETLGFDIRNANDISNRTDTSFQLSYSAGNTVSYAYANNTITRTENGQTRNLFNNISEFDVLTDASDEPSDGSLTYDDARLSIEKLAFSRSRGGAGTTAIEFTNFTFSKRTK